MAVIAAFVAPGGRAGAQTGADVRTAQMVYQQIPNWGQLPAGTKWGSMTAVDIDAAGTVTPYGLFMTKDDILYVVDGTQGNPDEFLTIVDTKNMNILGQIHGLTGPHMVSVSTRGDIYVAEVRGMSVKKFVKK